jgi:dethiobiotin synthetase
MSAIFISATGTDIGKTFVAASLIRHLRATGQAVEALKPVATGFNPADAGASDSGVLLAALDRPVTSAEIERVTPFRFSAPLSPDMAAQRENRTVDYEALVGFSRAAVASTKSTLLIEGIGGVMVPLDEKHTVLDWMAALGIPVLLVAGSYLGSMSHTLTSLDALRHRSIAVKILAVNESAGTTVPIADTVATLKRFIGRIPIVTLRRPPASNDQAFADIVALL